MTRTRIRIAMSYTAIAINVNIITIIILISIIASVIFRRCRKRCWQIKHAGVENWQSWWRVGQDV